MIDIQQVTFTHAHALSPSLKDVTIQIPAGQCVLICGESGSGKTTLTRLINGLIPHYYDGELTGHVGVEGCDVAQTELYELAPLVGSVFQNPRSQFFCVDTSSELAFGCENIGLPKEEIIARVKQTVQELKLGDVVDRNIFELSGGEKQKVACGSVACLNPKIMVLDEPTSNLDVFAIEQLKQTIKLWRKQGKTVIIAEHRLYWLTDVCDRVICMHEGRITHDESMSDFKKLDSKTIKKRGLRSLTLCKELEITHERYTSRQAYLDTYGVLRLENFMYRYNGVLALDIPKLDIEVGSVVAVIGMNGAGKSTFARCLCGLQKGFKGTVTQDGKVRHAKQQLKKCYLVMQDVNHQLFCETVEEEIQLGMKEDNADAVGSVLLSLDLKDVAQRHPMSLSGGQKQRVAVASSLLAEKSIMVFDEPTSGLDYHHMVQAANLIAELKGVKTVFIVTHDPELVCRCATHIMHMQKGHVKDFYPLDDDGMCKVHTFFDGSIEQSKRGVYE